MSNRFISSKQSSKGLLKAKWQPWDKEAFSQQKNVTRERVMTSNTPVTSHITGLYNEDEL